MTIRRFKTLLAWLLATLLMGLLGAGFYYLAVVM